MRAKDYIAYNTDKLMFVAELKTTIDRFSDCRNNYSVTYKYYKSHLDDAEKWQKFILKCNNKTVNVKKYWEFKQELQQCIDTDLSFSYLKDYLSGKDKSEINPTSPDLIDEYIALQYENYPQSTIDDYLTTDISKEFIKTLDCREYDEAEELQIFDSAYHLFDEIRQQLFKIRHSTHIYKEFVAPKEQIKDDVLRLLSFFIHDYQYDVTKEQRACLDLIANELGKYILQRNKRSESRERWAVLKSTIDNMISVEEKLKMLITERTEYLQLQVGEQIRIDSEFAEKCQLEIDKIKEIQTLTKASPDSDSDIVSNSKLRTMKVTTDTIYMLLKKLNIVQNADNVAVAAFINYLTDFSKETIRQWLSKNEQLTSAQKKEVDYVNELLSKLNIKETINYNK